jgi:transposase
MERPMLQSNDLSRSFTALNQDNTLIVVIEMGQSSWLVAGMVPGIERQPLKKLEPNEDKLLKLMNRWRHEALQAGHAIERVVVAYEAGRDGFWCAPRRYYGACSEGEASSTLPNNRWSAPCLM